MDVNQKGIKTLLIALVMTLTFAETSHAYLDPGSGSFIFQMIIASVVGGLFAIKLCWVRIKASLKSFISRDK